MTSDQTQRIAILMGTYNGQDFLKVQLKSFLDQTHTNWQIYASDDGSKDDTLSILSAFQNEHGVDRISISSGPKLGFCANFLSLVCNDEITADYYAYSDQDDVWEANKLKRAVDALKEIPSNTPALYCSRTAFVDNDYKLLGHSKRFTKKPCFENALVQCIAGGNTMVFNNAARKLLHKVSNNINVLSHDWWTYLVITACGGVVIYDDYLSLQYRQHGSNQVGMNTTWFAKLFRFRQLLKGNFRNWNNQNVTALLLMEKNLTPENKKSFNYFIKARNAWLFPRVYYFLRSRIHRQTLTGNIGLIIAILLGKI